MRMMSGCFTWFPNCLVLGEPFYTTIRGCFTRKGGFDFEVFWWVFVFGGGRLLRVGNFHENSWCSRSPWSPSGSISWGEDCSSLTHTHEESVSVGDSNETFWCYRGSFSPRVSIRRGKDGSWITHRHECIVSVGDSIEKFWYSRSPWSPWDSIRRGEDGSFPTHRNK